MEYQRRMQSTCTREVVIKLSVQSTADWRLGDAATANSQSGVEFRTPVKRVEESDILRIPVVICCICTECNVVGIKDMFL